MIERPKPPRLPPRTRAAAFLITLFLSMGVPSAARARVASSLEQIVARAQARAVAVTDARGAVAVADAPLAGAKLGPLGNPTLEILTDRSRITRDVTVSASAYLPIEVAGQRGARVAEVERLGALARERLAATRAIVAADAIVAYGQLAVAETRLVVAHDAEAAANDERDWFEARLAAADATAFDASLARAEAARWSQLRAQAEIDVARARHRLAELTGEERVAIEVGATPAPPRPREAWTPALRKALVEQTPAVRLAHAELAFHGAAEERARRDASPPVSIVLTGGRGDLAETRVGGGLAWTLPVLRRNQAEIARASAEQERVRDLLVATRKAVEARLASAHETYGALRAAVTSIDDVGLPAAAAAVTAATESFRAGKGERLAVLVARRDLAATQARRLDLLEAAWRAYADMTALKGDMP